MNREDAIRKIVSCLALGDSPNEDEAKTALLMARRLMAKYKIEESEIEVEDDNPVEQKETEHIFTYRSSAWKAAMAMVIAENHCCMSFCQHRYRSKSYTIMFMGKSEDVRICIAAMNLAVAAVDEGILRNHLKGDSAYAYANGFTRGLKKAYNKQNEENESYALVLSVPQEVRDYTDGLAESRSSAQRKRVVDSAAYYKGFQDGEGHLTPRLEEA